MDFAILGKVMQVNTQAIIITEWGRPIHLVSHIKKICIWWRRFGYASNIKVIRALKLLTGIKDFSKNCNSAEIYNDSKAFKPEASLDNPNLTDNNSANTNTVIKTMMKISKITNSNFDKICELCMKSKQTWVVC